MADDDAVAAPDLEWRVQLDSVERLVPDGPDDDEVMFAVEFSLSGLGLSGSLTAMIADPADETTIVAEAVDMLLVGLEEFGAALRLRVQPDPAESKEG